MDFLAEFFGFAVLTAEKHTPKFRRKIRWKHSVFRCAFRWAICTSKLEEFAESFLQESCLNQKAMLLKAFRRLEKLAPPKPYQIKHSLPGQGTATASEDALRLLGNWYGASMDPFRMNIIFTETAFDLPFSSKWLRPRPCLPATATAYYHTKKGATISAITLLFTRETANIALAMQSWTFQTAPKPFNHPQRYFSWMSCFRQDLKTARPATETRKGNSERTLLCNRCACHRKIDSQRILV